MTEIISFPTTQNKPQDLDFSGLPKYAKMHNVVGINGLPIENEHLTLAITDYSNMSRFIWEENLHRLIISNNIRQMIAEVRNFVITSYKNNHPKVSSINNQLASDIIMDKTKALLVVCSYLEPQLKINDISTQIQSEFNLIMDQNTLAA